MDANIFLIALVVFHGIGMMLAYFRYIEKQNLYTQKVRYMNGLIEKHANIMEYRFNESMPFKLTMDGYQNYPPKIYDRYKANPDYQRIILDFEKEQQRLRKTLIYLIISLVVTFLLTVALTDITLNDISQQINK